MIQDPTFNYSFLLHFFFLKAVARVGAQLASHYGEAEEREKFQELITDAEWGIQLGKFGVSVLFNMFIH